MIKINCLKIPDYHEIIFTPQVSEEQVQKLAEHCNIDNFKKNDAVNMKPPKGAVPEDVREKFNFIRKGKVGDWKNHFKDECKLDMFNQWIEENNSMKIPIKYEL